MAAGSLGRLTLDLAVRLSEFTDGLSRAERETRERTENMSEATAKFKEQLIENLSGTPIGGAIESLTSKLDDITEAFGDSGIAGAAKIGGLAIAGAFVGATSAIVTMALKTAEADEQLERLAKRGNTSTQNLQVLTAAAAKYGLEMDGIGDILADAQEKLGEFSANGGGGLVDTLERMGKATKMTEEELAVFGNSLSTMDSVDAIQAVVNEMEKAGATTQEVRFVTESLASGLGDIIPLWDNNGAALEGYDRMLNQAGVIRTKESIEQSKILAQQTQIMKLQLEGVSNQIVSNSLPALSSLVSFMSSGTDGSKDLGKNLSVVGFIANSAASFVIGLATVFKSLGYVIAGVGATLGTFFRLVSNVVRSPLNILSHVNAYLAESGRIGTYVVADINTAALKGGAAINNIWNPATAALVDGRGGVTGNIPKMYASDDDDKAKNTSAVKANTTALEKAQKIAGEVKLTPNAKALANADKYGFAGYEAKYGLPYGLMTGIHMQESHGNTNATGPMTKYGKAKGGFQFIDDTAKRYGVSNAYNMEQATEGAAKYLSFLYKRFNGDLAKTVAAYNTGEGNVDKNPMSLILSDRWARNKKTGIGQTKEYTKNVLGYMKAVSGETGKIVYDSITEQNKQEEKLKEETLRRQGSIVAKYATEREKIESDHIANITEIESLYAEGSLDRIKYLAREQADYDEKRTAASRSILESYMAGEEKLTYEHNQKIEKINAEFIEGDPTRQLLVDLQDAAYKDDLANFRFAANAKAREQDKLYQSIANSIKANRNMAASDGLDRIAQRTMSEDDYAVWRLAQDHDESYNSVNNQYADRQSEINARDERDNFLLPELERNELLEIARQEHLDAMWAMEQDHALKQQTLDEQMADKRVAIQEMAFGSMTSVAAMFFGENSKMHRAAFALERAFAVQKALMNVRETYSNTFNAISAIPLVGPYLAMPAAVAASALQVAQAAGISGMSAPSVSGIAHGGLDYVPKESTYLLDQGERVLSPRQNKDLAAFMEKGHQSSTGNIVINNNSSAQVSASRGPNGEVTVEMVDKMIEKSFRRIGSPNSVESKSIQRGTTARVNRR